MGEERFEEEEVECGEDEAVRGVVCGECVVLEGELRDLLAGRTIV